MAAEKEIRRRQEVSDIIRTFYCDVSTPIMPLPCNTIGVSLQCHGYERHHCLITEPEDVLHLLTGHHETNESASAKLGRGMTGHDSAVELDAHAMLKTVP